MQIADEFLPSRELGLNRDAVARLSDMIHDCDEGAGSLEGASRNIVRLLYDNLLVKETGDRALALVRLFKTHPFGELDSSLQNYVRQRLGQEPMDSGTPCLTLLASAGLATSWNSRHTSVSHKAIPLASPELIAKVPMIAQLFVQFGVDLNAILKPDPSVVLDLHETTYNVFHVEKVLGSQHVPDQEQFVVPYKICSVVGFGGMLPLGSIFAVILFSLVPVKREAAQLFVPLSVSVKIPLLTYAGKRIFD